MYTHIVHAKLYYRSPLHLHITKYLTHLTRTIPPHSKVSAKQRSMAAGNNTWGISCHVKNHQFVEI